MSPNRNPKLDLPMAAAMCLASVAACFVMTYRLIELAYDRISGRRP